MTLQNFDQIAAGIERAIVHLAREYGVKVDEVLNVFDYVRKVHEAEQKVLRPNAVRFRITDEEIENENFNLQDFVKEKMFRDCVSLIFDPDYPDLLDGLQDEGKNSGDGAD